MVLLEILSEIPKLHHFLTQDGCADRKLTLIQKTIFIETGIHFRVIKPSFFLILAFPALITIWRNVLSLLMKNKQWSTLTSCFECTRVDTTFRYLALHDICQDMSSPMMRVLSKFHVLICDMTTPLPWQDRWYFSILEMVNSFHPTTSLCSPICSAWFSVLWWHQNHRRICCVSKPWHHSRMQNNLIRSIFVYFAIAVQGVWP